MAVVAVQCPECGSEEVVRYGRQPNGEQRYRCDNRDCARRIFLLQYHNAGWVPEVKRQIVEMALNGSGIRVTAPLGERYRAKSGGEVSGKSEGAGVLPIAAAQAVVK